MTTLLHNIDDVCAEIMRLENEAIFNQNAWARVFADLAAQDRPAARADAQRRMETARLNATVIIGFDYGSGESESVSIEWPVAVETVPA